MCPESYATELNEKPYIAVSQRVEMVLALVLWGIIFWFA